MLGYLKLKTENKELYESDFLEKLKRKSKWFSKIQYYICYIFYELVVFIKYVFNIITVKQIYNSYIFIFPFDIEKAKKNGRKIKYCMNKLQKLLKKYKVHTVVLSNELKDIIKDSNLNINKKGLNSYLIKEIISYILEKVNLKTELEDIYLCVKEASSICVENIYYLSNYFRSINIVTPNINNFQKIADKIEEKGILMTVTNNKKKSLRRARFIVNFDFSSEEMLKYTIYRKAVIILIKKDEFYNSLSFDGVQIKEAKIDTSAEIKSIFKKYNLLESYSLESLYDIVLSENQNLNKVKSEMEKDEVKILKLYGKNGEISDKEYKSIVNQ